MASPMERVPYDVLREIILYSDKYTLKVGYNEPEFDLQVLAPPITESHVCRSWRRALLSDPTMWTCLVIPDMNPDGILELLRRSGSSSLNVFFQLHGVSELDYEETLGMLSTLFEQIHRFSVLRMQIDLWCYESFSFDIMEALVQVLMSSIQRPAPRLQAFSFSYMCLEVDKEFNPDDAVIGNLFSGNAPNLERVHHRLSVEPQESRCAVFNNLSELYLTPPYRMQLDTFLDLLEVSPRLKLLHFYVPADDGLEVFEPSSERKIHLPCLEKLVLEVDATTYILCSFMEYVTFPSNVSWHIVVLHLPGLEDSFPLLQLLSQARFTYSRVDISQSFIYLYFEEEPDEDRSNGNMLVYKYRAEDPRASFWNPQMRAITSSHITHMDLEPNDLVNSHRMLPTIFAQMSSLKSLAIRPNKAFSNNSNRVHSICLAALVPDLLNMIIKNTRTTNSIQNPEPDLVNTPAYNSVPPNPPTPVIHCPLLHIVALKLIKPLKTKQAEILSKCSELRLKMGHPLRIHVFCPSINEGVEHILQRPELNDTITVSIISLH